MTADGSEDDQITPEGIQNYKMRPPVEYLPIVIILPASNGGEGHEGKLVFRMMMLTKKYAI